MLTIRSAQITAFYLFDVSESIHLQRLPGLLQTSAQPARLASKPAIPSYVRYQSPPLQVDGDAIGVADLDGYDVRIKAFDYGVVSLSLTKAFRGSWEELIATAARLTVENALEAGAERICNGFVQRIHTALDQPRERFLSEDYFVFSVTAFDRPLSADAVVAEAGHEIARLLRAEIQPLSQQERDEVLRHRLSYLANDLVVPTWSTALVYDTEAASRARSRSSSTRTRSSLQFRYYDDLLNGRSRGSTRSWRRATGYNHWSAAPLHACRAAGTRALHRRQRADRSHGERAEARRRRVRRAAPRPHAHSRLGVTPWRGRSATS